jgi:hypothetical protein
MKKCKYFLTGLLLLCNALVYAQSHKSFYFGQSEGYYINMKGEKVYGLIRYVAPLSKIALNKTGLIEFKAEKKAKKQILKPEEVKEFFVEGDFRFISCLQPLEVKSGMFDATVQSDFLQVVKEGFLSLYYQYTPSGSNSFGGMSYEINMIVKKEGDDRYLRLPLLKGKRKEFLMELFPGDEDVIEVFNQNRPNKVLEALDSYNLTHKNAGK